MLTGEQLLEELVLALGARYGHLQQSPDGVLQLLDDGGGRGPVEVRVEAEWVRVFAPPGPRSDDLRQLLRANERFQHIRYGIEDGGVVLRADIPLRLWRASCLLDALAEIERAWAVLPPAVPK